MKYKVRKTLVRKRFRQLEIKDCLSSYVIRRSHARKPLCHFGVERVTKTVGNMNLDGTRSRKGKEGEEVEEGENCEIVEDGAVVLASTASTTAHPRTQ